MVPLIVLALVFAVVCCFMSTDRSVAEWVAACIGVAALLCFVTYACLLGAYVVYVLASLPQFRFTITEEIVGLLIAASIAFVAIDAARHRSRERHSA
jgi:hypothetical protein